MGAGAESPVQAGGEPCDTYRTLADETSAALQSQKIDWDLNGDLNWLLKGKVNLASVGV